MMNRLARCSISGASTSLAQSKPGLHSTATALRDFGGRSPSENTDLVYARNTSGMKRKGRIRPTYDWQTSARYMRSDVFKSTYGDHKVWELYRRSVPGPDIWYEQPNTRISCVEEDGKLSTNWPCPVCRDEYLVLHFMNTDLLKHFLDGLTGELLPIKRTAVCQHQYEQLQIAVLRAHDCGTLTFKVPYREYDYKQYYPDWESPPPPTMGIAPLYVDGAVTYNVYLGTLTFKVPYREYDYTQYYPDWESPPPPTMGIAPLYVDGAVTYNVYPVFNPEQKRPDFTFDVTKKE